MRLNIEQITLLDKERSLIKDSDINFSDIQVKEFNGKYIYTFIHKKFGEVITKEFNSLNETNLEIAEKHAIDVTKTLMAADNLSIDLNQ